MPIEIRVFYLLFVAETEEIIFLKRVRNMFIINRSFTLPFVVLACVYLNPIIAQTYQLSVPFSEAWIGDNTGNNSANNVVSFSSLGWSDARFTQESTSLVFVAQGNDIIGAIKFEDNAGITQTIDCFVKWRAPSGTVACLIVQPGAVVSATAATNGSNGASTYTINNTKYAGMIFVGSTMDLSSGVVTGNAATSGLLDKLNDYLGSLPELITTNHIINESDGSVSIDVSLSASSSNTVTVDYYTADSTAIAGSDYTSVSGTLTFLPGETLKSIVIPIVSDVDYESNEVFKMVLENSENAAIIKNEARIEISDPAPLSIVNNSFSIIKTGDEVVFEWLSERDQDTDFFTIYYNDGRSPWSVFMHINAFRQSFFQAYSLRSSIAKSGFYKVASTCFEGLLSESEVKFLTVNSSLNQTILITNSVADALHFSSEQYFQMPYSVFNMAGALVAKGVVLSSELLLPTLSKGFYVLTINGQSERFFYSG